MDKHTETDSDRSGELRADIHARDIHARVRLPIRAWVALLLAVLGVVVLLVAGSSLRLQGAAPMTADELEEWASKNRKGGPHVDGGVDGFDPYDNERSHAIVPGDSMLNSDWGECTAARPRPARCQQPRPELPSGQRRNRKENRR